MKFVKNGVEICNAEPAGRSFVKASQPRVWTFGGEQRRIHSFNLDKAISPDPRDKWELLDGDKRYALSFEVVLPRPHGNGSLVFVILRSLSPEAKPGKQRPKDEKAAS